MPIGPRLDRPSAIGDEGRPRATSLTITSLVVVGVMVAAGFIVGSPLLFTSVALVVGLLVAGVALLGRDRLGQQVLGHICFLPSAVFLAGIVLFGGVLAPGGVGVRLLVGGGLLALVGVAAGWSDVLGPESIKYALLSSGLSYIFWVLATVGFVLLVVAFFMLRGLLNYLAAGAPPVVGLVTVLALSGVAFGTLYLAVRVLPAVQVTPVGRRPAARERERRLRRSLVYGAVGSLGLTVPLALTAALLPMGQLLGPLAPVVNPAASLVSAVLAVVSAVALLIAAAVGGLRRATAERSGTETRTVAAAIAAVCYCFGLVIAVPSLLRFGIVTGLVGFIATPFLPLFVYAALLCLLVAFYVGVVPTRAGPAAFSAAGLLAVGLGSAVAGFPSLFVFGTIAGALVVWDVGTFGLGVTAELGHIPETRRLELYHGVVAAGVGVLGVVLLTLVDATRQSLAGGLGTPAAMGIAVLGVLLLLLPLRG